MLKKIIVTIIVILLLLVGYFIYQYYYADEITIFLRDLKKQTMIDFSGIKTVKFNWNVQGQENVETKEVEGKGFEAENITNEQHSNLFSSITNQGFKVDLYNITAGTLDSQTGYIKDNMVCLLETEIPTDKQGDPLIENKNVKVKCAKGEGLAHQEVSLEQAIKQIFAERYKTKLSAVEITSEERFDKAKGTFKILDVQAQDLSVDQGIFFALKYKDVWQILYESNQDMLPCDELRAYGFPDDMISDCK